MMDAAWQDTCAEVVELVSDYLDGVLPSERAEQVADHLAGCPGCTEYVDQVRRSVAGLAASDVADQLPADVRARLLEAFTDRPTDGP